MQKTARAAGIHDETGGDFDFLSMAFAVEDDLVRVLHGFVQFDFVEIVDADFLRLANEVGIDIGAIPVRIGDPIVGAGGNEQLIAATRISSGALAGLMVIKGEAAFESAVEVRIRLLPGAPFGEWEDAGRS